MNKKDSDSVFGLTGLEMVLIPLIAVLVVTNVNFIARMFEANDKVRFLSAKLVELGAADYVTTTNKNVITLR